ncbi:unnamed protein product [Clonostachys solani]|uniref:NADH:flavin oxidoreductase/NADH oxidase N-terminal domain-containing protein n=1 Tax=Clonostachys solani TaxID=160281 RepID=A0A9N9W221_9HYPO|nr:unnamed protein product [Clonostachys solani]
MSRLSAPVQVGSTPLEHRIALAPLTRLRCNDRWAPTELTKEYYQQRADAPGTLLITEATFISRSAASALNVGGIWEEEQVSAWREITEAVHAKGSKIFCQLSHEGRAGDVAVLETGGFSLLSSSAVPIDSEHATPKEMTEDDILEVIADFVKAAKNAIAAGFDGVEIQGANGYLLDQFIQYTCNKRGDKWGGTIENRVRFPLEVVKAVSSAIGADKTGLRLSPYSNYLGMGMDFPVPTFHYLLENLKPLGLAYLSLVEARISGDKESCCGNQATVRWMVEYWNNTSPVIIGGGFTPETALLAVEETYHSFDVIIAFGRRFISNPDLVKRVQTGEPLVRYDTSSFYLVQSPKGYTDYPFNQKILDGKVVRVF